MYNDPDLRRFCKLLASQPLGEALSSDDCAILADVAIKHDLVPFYHWQINKHHIPSLDDDTLRTLQEASQRATARYMLLQHAQLGITELFNRANIPHIWLKGIALCETVYPDASFRPMNDLDVFVPYELRSEAIVQLRSQGFELFKSESDFVDSNREAAADRWHHFKLRGGIADSIFLELHFRYLGHIENEQLGDVQTDWLSAQTWSYQHQGFTLATLKPEAQLLYLCAHIALQHGIATFVLKWYLDLHLLITRYDLNWKIIVSKAAEFQWTYTVERVLEITVELFSTPVPAGLFEELQTQRSLTEDTNRVDHLAGEAANLEMVRLLYEKMPWRGRLSLTFNTFVPPPQYMRQRYHIPPEKSVRSYYFYRWYDQLRQVMWVVQRRLRIMQHSGNSPVRDNSSLEP